MRKFDTIGTAMVALVLMASLSFADRANAQSALGEPPSDRWASSLFFYLWATGLEGTTAVAGNEVEVDESFSDLVENLAGALSLRFESHKNRWGYFLDGMYVNLDPSAEAPAGKVRTDVKNFIGEAGGSFHFNRVLEGLFGVRYQKLDIELKFPNAVNVGGDESWTDGFLGFRIVPLQNEKWRLWLRGDVAVAGDSDSMWNAAIGAGYSFNPRWSAVLAYRFLSDDFEEGGFKYDIDYSGIGLAVGYSF